MGEYLIALKSGISFVIRTEGERNNHSLWEEYPFLNKNGEPDKKIFIKNSEIASIIDISILSLGPKR